MDFCTVLGLGLLDPQGTASAPSVGAPWPVRTANTRGRTLPGRSFHRLRAPFNGSNRHAARRAASASSRWVTRRAPRNPWANWSAT